MTGIYALWFEESSMIYIGQSQDIKRRFRQHIKGLEASRHTNYKVQDHFSRFGMPEFIILEECSINALNDLEVAWTAEFDSINNGLNIIEAGQVGWGTNSNFSKYSKIQILRAFSLLYKTNLPQAEIARKIKMSKTTISAIKNSKSHLWLRDKYPNQYVAMKDRQTLYNTGSCSTWFIAPNGDIVYIKNATQYAKDNSISYEKAFSNGLSKLKLGQRKQYKGWKTLL